MLANLIASLSKISEPVWILAALGLAWAVVTLFVGLMIWRKTPGPNFEYHWGGLGRGVGGWSLSWSLVLVLAWLTLTFGGVSAAIEVLVPPSAPTQNHPASDDGSKPAADTQKLDSGQPAPKGAASASSKGGGE